MPDSANLSKITSSFNGPIQPVTPPVVAITEPGPGPGKYDGKLTTRYGGSGPSGWTGRRRACIF